MRDVLPQPVWRAISRHLVRAGHRAEDGFPSGEEEEDSLTGDLLRAVRRSWSADIQVDDAAWQWRVTTRKFRGRGEQATESLIGADGIVQIEVAPPKGTVVRKGVLFQAKKEWGHRDQDLLVQAQKMEYVAPGGAAVFDYGPDAYRAVAASTVIAADARPSGIHHHRLGEFLANEFLECRVGRRDTYYDWESEGLVLSGTMPIFARLRPQFLASVQAEGRIIE